MKPFTYNRSEDTAEATDAVAHQDGAEFLAGGTNLVDLMKKGTKRPDHLVDVNGLPLTEIEELPNSDVRIGALVSNSDVANNRLIRDRYPVLSEALLSGATGQLRNKATVGGNVMQRTRCSYYNDPSFDECNKRDPGSGCAALDGYNRNHAILGTSEHCIAVHPSDMCVALAALDADVHTETSDGEQRTIPMIDFHLLPEDDPQIETVLKDGELITAITLPELPFAHHSRYLKVRDRTSYAFALVSVAAALDIRNGQIEAARLALGGVGTKPCRAQDAETELVDSTPEQSTFERAAEIVVEDATTQEYNAFKVDLAKQSVIRTLNDLVTDGDSS